MYIVIVGAGDTGTPLIEMATQGGNEVVVVERDHERAERAAETFDCLVIEDDATSKETLREAGADRADALISTTDEDATNVMVCLLAQDLSVPSVVSVVQNPEHMSLFREVGVNTIENPQRLIADYLYRAIKRPSIVDFMRVGEEAEVFEIHVEPDAPIAGRTLAEAGDDGTLSRDILVVAVDRDGDGDPITPRGNTRIEAGDLLTVYSSDGVTPELTRLFGHHESD
ncbi:potassium channel family protein [Halobacterium zhouii]|uniref:potassium channel family protein n=1 Tax=Halobacterium zhouii TaxID=2902624 RepID=UPI001E653494|nr:TrkA family potassium uptake protein [Halobacterium zhouii]